MQTAKASILIVDDTQKNIHLLSDSLKAHFQILAANNGFKALEIARKLQPDLILLDIMMPEMDGYEVCKQLKSAPQTADIPVIFLTALCSTEEEYKGLLLGAADYISKPFNQQVLLTRIHTQLKLRQAQKELEEHNKKLEYLVEIRTRELSQAHARLKVLDAAKQDFLTAISHQQIPLDALYIHFQLHLARRGLLIRLARFCFVYRLCRGSLSLYRFCLCCSGRLLARQSLFRDERLTQQKQTKADASTDFF